MANENITEKYRETDKRILAIARRLFAQSGIVNIEMKDICKEMGCSRSTLYRHFESKEAILFRLAGNSVEKIMEAAIVPPRMKFENGYEALSWQIKAQVNFMLKNIDEIVFIRDFDFYYSKLILQKAEDQYEEEIMSTRGRDELLANIKLGMTDGSIKVNMEPELVCYTLVNACIAMAQRILPREGIFKKEMGYSREMLDLMTELLLSSLNK